MLFDEAIVETVVGVTPVWLAFLFLFISYLGSVYVLVPASLYGLLKAKRWEMTTWLPILLGGYAVFSIVKPLTDIPRPETASPIPSESLPVLLDQLHYRAVGFDTGSFPSGHTFVATVFYGLLVLDSRVSTPTRRLLGATLLVVLVGTARIVLGTHYPGDVIGGIALGIIYLGGMVLGRERLPQFASILLAGVAMVGLIGVVIGDVLESLLLVGGAVATYTILEWIAKRRQSLHWNRS